MGFVFLDPHPPPCGMDRNPKSGPPTKPRQAYVSADSRPEIPLNWSTPARNWRERRQKARVIAASYKRRKPEPVWDGPF